MRIDITEAFSNLPDGLKVMYDPPPDQPIEGLLGDSRDSSWGFTIESVWGEESRFNFRFDTYNKQQYIGQLHTEITGDIRVAYEIVCRHLYRELVDLSLELVP